MREKKGSGTFQNYMFQRQPLQHGATDKRHLLRRWLALGGFLVVGIAVFVTFSTSTSIPATKTEVLNTGISRSATETSEPKAHPSFDCHAAQSKVEQIICSSPELSQLDRRLSELYVQASRASSGNVLENHRESQEEWLRARSGLCDSAACLSKLYNMRIQQLTDRNIIQPITYWPAQSETAYSVTGNILLSPTDITFSGAESLRLASLGEIPNTTGLALLPRIKPWCRIKPTI